MRMKSYFADSVQLAMERARRELGADAVLVTSRAASLEARHLGGYEVVFATELPDRDVPAAFSPWKPAEFPDGRLPKGDPASAAALLAGEPAQTRRLPKASVESMLGEFQNLRRQFESWRQAGVRSAERPRWISVQPHLDELYDELAQQEVDRELIQKLLSAAESRAHSSCDPARPSGSVDLRRTALAPSARQEEPLAAAALRAALAAEIQAAIGTDETLGSNVAGPRTVALVGPPGAGKTSTIAKLAVRYGLTARKPAVLLSFDTLRVAASEQLRTYAGLLGIAFQILDTNRALAQALEEHQGKELILIDTAGYSFRDMEQGADTASFLASRGDIQKQLVLPATMRAADQTRYVAAYQEFHPSRLIFTRMDETEAFGTVLSETLRSRLPLSFFGTGQQVPDDLEPASVAVLLSRLLPDSQARSAKGAAA